MIVFMSIYCAPKLSTPIPTETEENWEKIKKVSHNAVLGADTNAHSKLLDYSKSDKKAQAWEEFMMQKDLLLLNDTSKFTFTNTRGHRSKIDWTLTTTTKEYKIDHWEVQEDWDILSDHKPITFQLIIETDQSMAPVKRNWRKANWEKFGKRLEKLIETHLREDWTTKHDLETAAEKFEEQVVKLIPTCVPRQKPKSKNCKWWNAKLTHMKKEMRTARRKNVELYREKKSAYEMEIKRAKEQDWKNFVENSKTAADCYLRYKLLCKTEASNRSLAPVLTDEGLTTTHSETAQEILNSLFPDLPEQLTEEQRRMSEEVAKFVEDESPMRDEPQITRLEIETAINSFAPHKTGGPDGIPMAFFQHLRHLLTPLLHKFYNSSLQLGQYPNTWKTAEVLFIRKPKRKGDNPNDYRPISLLKTIGKIYEKVLLRRLQFHGRQQGWTTNEQYGFQPGVSSEDCVLKLTNKIYERFKLNLETLVIFFDISGAFNDLFHDGFLYQLLTRGCSKIYVRLLKSYLSDKKITARDESKVSKILTKSSAQGSVLGPWMWNIMFQGLVDEAKRQNIDLNTFADDVATITRGRNRLELERKGNEAVRFITNWGKRWTLRFNHQKNKSNHLLKKTTKATSEALLSGKQHRNSKEPEIPRNRTGQPTTLE